MNPKISIVVPTFNQGRYIEKCLQSLAEQTESHFEVLIQDSCSTDQTEEICLRFAEKDPRFLYFREKDSGQSDALNRGLQRSKGIFWTWVCSDDYYSNHQSLEKLTQGLQDNPSLWAGSYGHAELVTEQAVYMEEYSTMTRIVDHEDFKTHWPFSQPASLLYREQVLQVGGINSELHLGMDLDLFIRLTADGKKFKYIPAKIASVRVQPDSKSVKFRIKTSECALGIIRFYYGGIGFPPLSSYCVELGRGRLEVFKNMLRSWKSQITQKVLPAQTTPVAKKTKPGLYDYTRHFALLPTRWVFKFLARFVLSFNSGLFFSYELLKMQKSKSH